MNQLNWFADDDRIDTGTGLVHGLGSGGLKLYGRLVACAPASPGDLTRVGPPAVVDELLERLHGLGLIELADDGAVDVVDPRSLSVDEGRGHGPLTIAEREALAELAFVFDASRKGH